MIYYDIQHHGNVDSIQWLASILDDGENFLNFSLDMGLERISEFSDWLENKNVNGRAKKSYPITWCGPSQMVQMQQSLHTALEVDGWEYFANLSGACFPNKSQKFIKKQLRHKYKDGFHSFAYTFVPNKPSCWISHTYKSIDFKFYRKNYRRLQLECTQDVVEGLENDFHPVGDVMQRRAVHCSEIAGEKKLYLRGLLPWELSARKKFWENNRYIIGRTWVILHRKQVEWLVSSKVSMEFYANCLNMFEPDETYIPSLLMSKENKFLGGVENNNFRYLMGGPRVIRRSDIDKIFKSPCFFARKLPGYPERKIIEKDIEFNLNIGS